MRFFLIVFILIIFSALVIISNNNLALYKQENISEFDGLYRCWVDQVFTNTKTITGEVVRMNWFPENQGNI